MFFEVTKIKRPKQILFQIDRFHEVMTNLKNSFIVNGIRSYKNFGFVRFSHNRVVFIHSHPKIKTFHFLSFHFLVRIILIHGSNPHLYSRPNFRLRSFELRAFCDSDQQRTPKSLNPKERKEKTLFLFCFSKFYLRELEFCWLIKSLIKEVFEFLEHIN